MINPNHLMQYVIEPVLEDLGWNSLAARLLVLETGFQESRLAHLDQLGGDVEKPGPAYGIYQQERGSHNLIWRNWIHRRPEVSRILRGMLVQKVGTKDIPNVDELHWNLYYATAMCRVYYRQIPVELPDNLKGRAAYWKKYYNTVYGRGTTKQYLKNAETLHRVFEGGKGAMK